MPPKVSIQNAVNVLVCACGTEDDGLVATFKSVLREDTSVARVIHLSKALSDATAGTDAHAARRRDIFAVGAVRTGFFLLLVQYATSDEACRWLSTAMCNITQGDDAESSTRKSIFATDQVRIHFFIALAKRVTSAKSCQCLSTALFNVTTGVDEAAAKRRGIFATATVRDSFFIPLVEHATTPEAAHWLATALHALIRGDDAAAAARKNIFAKHAVRDDFFLPLVLPDASDDECRWLSSAMDSIAAGDDAAARQREAALSTDAVRQHFVDLDDSSCWSRLSYPDLRTAVVSLFESVVQFPKRRIPRRCGKSTPLARRLVLLEQVFVILAPQGFISPCSDIAAENGEEADTQDVCPETVHRLAGCCLVCLSLLRDVDALQEAEQLLQSPMFRSLLGAVASAVSMARDLEDPHHSVDTLFAAVLSALSIPRNRWQQARRLASGKQRDEELAGEFARVDVAFAALASCTDQVLFAELFNEVAALCPDAPAAVSFLMSALTIFRDEVAAWAFGKTMTAASRCSSPLLRSIVPFPEAVQATWAQIPPFLRSLSVGDAATNGTAPPCALLNHSAAIDAFEAYLIDPLSDAIMDLLNQNPAAEEQLVDAAKRHDYDAVVALLSETTAEVPPPPPTPAYRRFLTDDVYHFLKGDDPAEPEPRSPTMCATVPAAVSAVRPSTTRTSRCELVAEFQRRCCAGGGPISLSDPLWTDTLRFTDVARVFAARCDVQHIVVCCERAVADCFVVAPGRSVTIVAQSFELDKTEGKVGIDVSGPRGADGVPGTAALCEEGRGKDADHGRPGESAGHVTIFAQNMEAIYRKGDLVFVANGGAGGRGGDGGDGAQGTPGIDGADATADLSGRTSYHHCFVFRRGEPAARVRGQGGAGGDAGVGGDGGSAGSVRLLGDRWKLDFQAVESRPIDGQPGAPGEGGRGGLGGMNGTPGLDSQLTARSSWFGGASTSKTHASYVDRADVDLRRDGYVQQANGQWTWNWFWGKPDTDKYNLESRGDGKNDRETKYRASTRGRPGQVRLIGEKEATNVVHQVSMDELSEFLSLHSGTLQQFGCGWAVESLSRALVDDNLQDSLNKENVVGAPAKLRRATLAVQARAFSPSVMALAGTDVAFEDLERFLRSQESPPEAIVSAVQTHDCALSLLLSPTALRTKPELPIAVDRLSRIPNLSPATPSERLLSNAALFVASARFDSLWDALDNAEYENAQRLLGPRAIPESQGTKTGPTSQEAQQLCREVKKNFPGGNQDKALSFPFLKAMALIFVANEAAESLSRCEHGHGSVLRGYLKRSCDRHEALAEVVRIERAPPDNLPDGIETRIAQSDPLFSHLLTLLRCARVEGRASASPALCLPAVGLLLTRATGNNVIPSSISQDLTSLLLALPAPRMTTLFAALTRNSGVTVPPEALVAIVRELSTMDDDQAVTLLSLSLDQWQSHCRSLQTDRLLGPVPDELRRSGLRAVDRSRAHRGITEFSQLRRDIAGAASLQDLVSSEARNVGVLEKCDQQAPNACRGQPSIEEYSARCDWLGSDDEVLTVAKTALFVVEQLEFKSETLEKVQLWRATLRIERTQSDGDPAGSFRAFRAMLTNHHPAPLCNLLGYAAYTMFKTVSLRPHPDQMLAAAVLLMKPGPSLSRIVTGGGKTLIVALAAAVRAIFGIDVDIVTANSALATSGEATMRPFFVGFFGQQENAAAPVACGVPVRDSSGRFSVDQTAYAAKVLYTTAPQLCSDMLDAENGEPPRFWSKRNARYMIADEVDVLLLDRFTEVLYRAQVIPELQHMLPLLRLIWSNVEQAPSDGLRCAIADDVLRAVDDGEVWLGGDRLAEHARTMLPTLVESAFFAKQLRVDREYVLVNSGYVKIVPYDLCIGEELQSTTWSNGLSQFLQLKHGLRLSAQAPHAQWVSARKLITGYKDRFCGVSGTLGTARLHDLFRSRFGIRSVVEFPPSAPSRFVRDPDIVTASKREWLDAVEAIVRQTVADGRIVHVISESISRSRLIEAHLSNITVAGSTVSIHTYRCNTDTLKPNGEAENKGQGQEFTTPCVILATNKGGRGTDIKISRAINERGGVKVVVTEPMSGRLLTQAFGRAARQGDNGSGCLVLHTGAPNVLDAVNDATDAELKRVAEMIDSQQRRVEVEDRIGGAANKRWAQLRNSLDWLPPEACVGSPQPLTNSSLRIALAAVREDEVQSAFALWLADKQVPFNWVEATLKQIEEFENEALTFLQNCDTHPISSTAAARVGHVFLKHENEVAALGMFSLLPDDPVGANSLGRGTLGLSQVPQGSLEFTASAMDLLAARARITLHMERLQLALPEARGQFDPNDEDDSDGHDHSVVAGIVGTRTCLATICDKISEFVGGPTTERVQRALPPKHPAVSRVWYQVLQHCDPCTVRAVGNDTFHFVSHVLSAFPPLVLQARELVEWFKQREHKEVKAEDLPLATAERVWQMLLQCGVLTGLDKEGRTATIENVSLLSDQVCPHADPRSAVMWPVREHAQRLLLRRLAAEKATVSLSELNLPLDDTRLAIFDKFRAAAVITPWYVPQCQRERLTLALEQELQSSSLVDAVLRSALGTSDPACCALRPLTVVFREVSKESDVSTRTQLHAAAEHVPDLEFLSLHVCPMVAGPSRWERVAGALCTVAFNCLISLASSWLCGGSLSVVCVAKSFVFFGLSVVLLRVAVHEATLYWRNAIEEPLRRMIRHTLEALSTKVTLRCAVAKISHLTTDYISALLAVWSSTTVDLRKSSSDEVITQSLEPLQCQYSHIVANTRTARLCPPPVCQDDLEEEVTRTAHRVTVGLDIELVHSDLYRTFVRSTAHALQKNRNILTFLNTPTVEPVARPFAYPDPTVALRSFASVSKPSPALPPLRQPSHRNLEFVEQVVKQAHYTIFRVRTENAEVVSLVAAFSPTEIPKPSETRSRLDAAVKQFKQLNIPDTLHVVLPPHDWNPPASHAGNATVPICFSLHQEWCSEKQMGTVALPAWLAGGRSLAVCLAVRHGVALVKESYLGSVGSVEQMLLGLPTPLALALRYASATSVSDFAQAVAEVAIDLGSSDSCVPCVGKSPSRALLAWTRLCACVRACVLSKQIAFAVFHSTVDALGSSLEPSLRHEFECVLTDIRCTVPCVEWCLTSTSGRQEVEQAP